MASMGAVQSAILGTVMENKMAVATMEGREWVREEHLSTEETWGVGHITLGDVCAEHAQPLVQEWSPEALGDGSAEGAGLLALVAARGADEQWAQILGGLGWAAVEMVGGSALDFAREWLWQLLPSPEAGSAARDPRMHGHVLLFSLGSRLADAEDAAQCRRMGAQSAKRADYIVQAERARAAQVSQRLREYLDSQWAPLSACRADDSADSQALLRGLVAPLCLATNWRSVETVVTSLHQWRISVDGTETARQMQPVVAELLRNLSESKDFVRACSSVRLVQSLVVFVAAGAGAVAAGGALQPADVQQCVDFAVAVRRIAGGITDATEAGALESSVVLNAAQGWTQEKRMATIRELQPWSALGGFPPLTADGGRRELMGSLRHESVCAIVAILHLAPVKLNDGLRRWCVEAEQQGYRPLRSVLHHAFVEVVGSELDAAYGDDALLAEVAAFAVAANFVRAPMEPRPHHPQLSLSTIPMGQRVLERKLSSDMALSVELVLFALASLVGTSTCVRVCGYDLLQALLPWVMERLGVSSAGWGDEAVASRRCSRERLSVLSNDSGSDAAQKLCREAADFAHVLTEPLLECALARLGSLQAGCVMDREWLWELTSPWFENVRMEADGRLGLPPTETRGAPELLHRFGTGADFLEALLGACCREWESSRSAVVSPVVLQIWSSLARADGSDGSGAALGFLLDFLARRLLSLSETQQEPVVQIVVSLFRQHEPVPAIAALAAHFSPGHRQPGTVQTDTLGAIALVVELVSRASAAQTVGADQMLRMVGFLLQCLDSTVDESDEALEEIAQRLLGQLFLAMGRDQDDTAAAVEDGGSLIGAGEVLRCSGQPYRVLVDEGQLSEPQALHEMARQALVGDVAQSVAVPDLSDVRGPPPPPPSRPPLLPRRTPAVQRPTSAERSGSQIGRGLREARGTRPQVGMDTVVDEMSSSDDDDADTQRSFGVAQEEATRFSAEELRRFERQLELDVSVDESVRQEQEQEVQKDARVKAILKRIGEEDEAAGAAGGPAGSEGERLAASLAHLLL